MNLKKISLLVPILILFQCCDYLPVASAIEATFTPEPDKDTGSTDGPLPQSQAMRDQLLQLDQQIAQSPNPQETLQKVAEGNGMTKEELGDLLIRNRRDMEMAGGASGAGGGGGGGGLANTLPRQIIRNMSTLILLIFKSAPAHPRSFSLVAFTLIALLYIILSAPRSGVVLSTGGKLNILSSGHTTLLEPPSKYLSKVLESDSFRMKESSLEDDVKLGSLSKLFLKKNIGEDNDVEVLKLSKKDKKKLSFAVTAKKNVPFEVLLPSEEEMELLLENELEGKGEDSVTDEDKVLEDLEDDAWEDAMILAFTSTDRVFSSRRFSEFLPDSNKMRFYSSPIKHIRNHARRKEEDAILYMKSMGDFKRFGVQPLRLALEENSKDKKYAVYHTLKGGHFDGELCVMIEKHSNVQDEDDSITITVNLVIPKKGRKISSKLASKLVSSLAESIATSSITGAKQIASRKQQSRIFKGKAQSKAAEKRHIAYENIKKMEEMAAERRRRWQRNNAGSGNYRPSGHMMRGPGGGPSRSF